MAFGSFPPGRLLRAYTGHEHVSDPGIPCPSRGLAGRSFRDRRNRPHRVFSVAGTMKALEVIPGSERAGMAAPGFHGVWRPAGSRVPAGRAALAAPGAVRPGSLPHWAQRDETGLLLPGLRMSRRGPGDGARGPALCGFVPGRGAIPGPPAGCLPFRTSRRSPSSSSPWRAPR